MAKDNGDKSVVGTMYDSVFTNMFRDKKYLLEAYRVFHPEDTKTTVDDLKILTINHVIINDIYNDLGFSVGDSLIILVEAQSTWADNIVVRALLYLLETYKDYIEENKLDVYGSKVIKLPVPEVYVVFTGTRKKQPRYVSLKNDIFKIKSCCLDFKVEVIYERDSSNDILNQYIKFSKVYQKQYKKYGKTRETIEETIRICKYEDILANYLASREKELVNMIDCLYNQEKVIERHIEAQRKEIEAEARADERAKANEIIAKKQAKADEIIAQERAKADEANKRIAEERIKANENLFSTLVETWKEFGKTIPETIDKVVQKFNLTHEEAEAKVLQYWGD